MQIAQSELVLGTSQTRNLCLNSRVSIRDANPHHLGEFWRSSIINRPSSDAIGGSPHRGETQDGESRGSATDIEFATSRSVEPNSGPATAPIENRRDSLRAAC